MKRNKAIDALNKLMRHKRLAHNGYVRYTWHPGTTSGDRALRQWEHNEELAEKYETELRRILENL